MPEQDAAKAQGVKINVPRETMNKIIPITCTGSKYIAIDKLVDLQGNLKERTEEQLNKLKHWIIKHGFSFPFFIWKSDKNYILDGHGRYAVIKEMLNEGYSFKTTNGKINLFPYVNIDAKDKTEAKEKLLAMNSNFGFITHKGLYDYINEFNINIDFKAISPDLNLPYIQEDWFIESFINDNLLEDLSKDKKELTLEKLKEVNDIEIIEKTIKEYDYFLFEYSGGKDSSLTLLKMIPLLKGKNIEACYVDTGAEFPDLIDFVIDFCDKIPINLKIIQPHKNIISFYKERKKFPDVIYRDCLNTFIANPIDKYVKTLQEKGYKVLSIRGGRKGQKTTKSNSDLLQVLKSQKREITLLNPLFNMSNDEFDTEIKKIRLWEGYKRGFDRTACWFCPFQKVSQWEALKTNYPMLFNKLFDYSREWLFYKHSGDSNIIRFIQYWSKQDYV